MSLTSYFKELGVLDVSQTTIPLTLDVGQMFNGVYATAYSNLVQFTISDENGAFLTVMTWDLVKNIEYSMIQIKGNYDAMKDLPGLLNNQICRGINSKLNYVVTHDNFFDLQFNLPMKLITEPGTAEGV
jgi:hypothetical protein